jgi:hypothetical protein
MLLSVAGFGPFAFGVGFDRKTSPGSRTYPEE